MALDVMTKRLIDELPSFTIKAIRERAKVRSTSSEAEIIEAMAVCVTNHLKAQGWDVSTCHVEPAIKDSFHIMKKTLVHTLLRQLSVRLEIKEEDDQ